MKTTFSIPKRILKKIHHAWHILLPKTINWYGDGELRLEIPCQCEATIENRRFGLSMGAYSYSGTGLGQVTVGRYCSIGESVMFSPTMHPIDRITSNPGTYMTDRWGFDETVVPFADRPTPATIGHDVWIGSRATIMSGITIGNGAVIATGAVVTKNVPPYAIVGGVPAKVIRYRFSPDFIRRLQESRWWEYDLFKSPLPIHWDRSEQSLEEILEAVRNNRLKKISPSPVLTLNDLQPFVKQKKFYFRFRKNCKMLRIGPWWLLCKLPPLEQK